MLHGVDMKEIVEQIEAKKKCKTKLPTWYNTQNIYYPNKLNIEQSSSEITAKYKANLVKGKSLIDITGGFGVDAFYFSEKIESVVHCELNKELSKIAFHNYSRLGKLNINCVSEEGLKYLKATCNRYDWIYVDPSRRHETKGKIFFLEDCEPNIPENLDELFEYADNILLKTSPLLDIKAGLNELHSVKEIHIVALNNEVKELLWVLDKAYKEVSLAINTVNIRKNSENELFLFEISDEARAIAEYSAPLTYLYEPNAAIMKSGAFKLISEKLNVKKLHPNAHLYTSEELLGFPGRRFKILEALAYNKKALKHKFKGLKANVGTRNFPEPAAQIKKQFGIEDGGSVYMFFTTKKDHQKMVLICSKIL
ncbi:MAG: class I SAM-dependent methyltransferase [Flavobacteriaceae bacterium]|nr:class I SAM-dependent methyltransferase [Flavobacteriaceae bacterium]